MFDRIVGYTSRLLNLAEETKRNREDLKELQNSLKQTQKELRDLTETMQRFAFETQRRYENEAHEREKMELRLQVAVLRSERTLPSGDKPDIDAVRALQDQVNLLQREVDALRQRVQELENM